MTNFPGAADAQAVAQQLLSSQGGYSALEWLLETNRLDYDAYRAWRRGERATLDEALIDDTGNTRELLEYVDSWARSLDLNAEAVALYGIDDNAGAELTASTDGRFDELLHTQFRPAANRVQLDLFLDTKETAAMNAVAEALATRDAATAEAQLDGLSRVNPNHWAIGDASALIEALRAPPPQSRDQAQDRLDVLERKWRPAAGAILRAGARDFLAPLWRDLGRGLAGAPFDPARPRRHASWAHGNGLDWENVRRAVHAVPDYRSEAVLLQRLADAEWRLRNRRLAVELWFALCWRAPEHFEAMIEAAEFPDPALKRAWRLARDARLEPPLTALWFPAWALLEEPNLAAALTPRGGDSDAERAFDVLLVLATGGSDRQDIDSRRELQAIHPGLLQRYLDSLGG